MNKILQNFSRKNNHEIPIWLMRQAGRYMAEYMAIRSDFGNFLDLCYNSEKAAEVTMQPIDKFDMDAAILFSDILVLPHALGWDVAFAKGEGPILKQFTSEEDLKILEGDFDIKINHIYDTVTLIKAKLKPTKALIGFAGSPWTVASYMLEGRGKTDFSISKKFLYEQNELAKKLITLLSEKTIEYLSKQIEAGADIIQLFDSWSGMLNENLYRQFVISPTKKIVETLKTKYPNIPIIGFPKGSGFNYDIYIEQTGIDGVSVDHHVPVEKMKLWQQKLVVQGNLDPMILLCDKKIIKKAVDNILLNLENNNFIFNLGHGILPNTPVENVMYLVDYVKNFRK
jgi:uroporphyrinogen decarboxylase